MLLALLTMWLLGGDADARPVLNTDLVREIREVVVDQARAERVIGSIRDFDEARGGYFDALEVAIEDLIEINRDHEASRDQYEALLANADALRDSTRQQFITTIMEVRAELTEEEWAAVVAASRAR